MSFTSQHRRTRHRKASNRRGFGIIPIIAVFAIAIAICGLWTRSSLAQHRDQLLREERLQTAWLAEAGVRRGAARRARDATFEGETWEIPAAEIGRTSSAVVVISIEPADATAEAAAEAAAQTPPGGVRIVARASYPRDNPRVTVSKTVNFTPPLPEPTS